MTASDISAGLRLCRLSGWNQLECDWTLFFETEPARLPGSGKTR
jgi:hypothetical protein